MTREEAQGDLRALLVMLKGRPDIRIDVHDAHPRLMLTAIEMGGEFDQGDTACWVQLGRLTLFADSLTMKKQGEAA